MKEYRWALGVAAVLVVLGGGLVSLRLWAQQHPRPRRGESYWRLRYFVEIARPQSGTRLNVALPADTAQARTFREEFTHPSFSMDIVRNKQTGAREGIAVLVWRSVPARLEAQFDIHMRAPGEARGEAQKEALGTTARARYLRSEPTIQAADPMVASVLARISQGTKTGREVLAAIFEHCSEGMARRAGGPVLDARAALVRGEGGPVGRARAMVALCRAARLPARLVTGIVLEATLRARPRVWVEVHLKKQWVPYDPWSGFAGELPASYVPVRRDGGRIVRGADAQGLAAEFSIRRLSPPRESGRDNGRFLDVMDLGRLPIGMQETLAVLLLLPLGALITAVWRVLIGLQTFGTFTPALLALSFVYSDWWTGLPVLAVVLAVGLCGRALLERLKLLMVPRLSVVLTLIVLCTALAVSILDYYGLTPSARAVVLPLVILVMLIERFHIRIEEDGRREALKLLAATFVVASCCYALLRWRALGRLALTFPEAQCLVAAALILVGRYTGYRLTELVRFRDLVGSHEAEGRP
jgi:transglutaminase-like putative cysteine protease